MVLCILMFRGVNRIRLINMRCLTTRGHDVGRSTNESEFLSQGKAKSFIRDLVAETQLALQSGDDLISRRMVRMYQAIGEHTEQLRALSQAIDGVQRSISNLAASTKPPGSSREIPRNYEDQTETCHRDEDSAVGVVFFDCVSRFSSQDIGSSIQSARSSFSGSPEYWLERRAGFYPEQYVSGIFPRGCLFLTAVGESNDTFHRIDCYLLYASLPRRWHRVHFQAAVSDPGDILTATQIITSEGRDEHEQTLPKKLQRLLSVLLLDVEFFEPVTSLGVTLERTSDGEFAYDPRDVRATEDQQESMSIQEDQILNDLHAIGCDQYWECDVVAISQLSSLRFLVRIGDQLCVERKAPFADAAQNRNGFQSFVSELKKLYFLRDSARTAQFRGLVLDDDRKHLKGFLYEPLNISPHAAMELAMCRGTTIPWSLREFWAKQFVQAVFDFHSRGFVMGSLNFGLRNDGSAAFQPQNCTPWMTDKGGYLAPELRGSERTGADAMRQLSYQTDIFQLGLSLFTLARHLPHECNHYYCTMSHCTKFPRYRCTSAHTNPVQLPDLPQGFPPYLETMIQKCRETDPKARPTARELLDIVADVEAHPDFKMDMERFRQEYSNTFLRSRIHCDECGSLSSQDHYHCNICEEGNFNLCPTCVSHGVHCWYTQHKMIRRVLRDGILVDGS